MLKRAAACALLLVVGLTGLAAPGRATEASTTFVTVSGSAGSHLWYPGSGAITVTGQVDGIVNIHVSGGPTSNEYDFAFAAAPGEVLAAGQYDNAERTYNRTEGHPGIDLRKNYSSCSDATGRFTVKDITADLSRLWIVYEHGCGTGWWNRSFGEIRFNVPGGDSELLVAPGTVGFPGQNVDTLSNPVAVRLVNTGITPVTVAAAAITSGSSSFTIANNNCSTVNMGASCTIGVAFGPPDPGDFTGTLTITDSTSAGTHTVALSGTGVPVPVKTTISTVGTTFDYGDTAKVTATLTGTYSNPQVSIYQKIGTSPRVLVATKNVDSAGKAVVYVVVKRNTIFSVDWAEGEQSRSANSPPVRVHAQVVATLSGYSRKSGVQYLYPAGRRMYVKSKTTPAKPGQCIIFLAQYQRQGQWLNLATTGCIRMNSSGVAVTYLPYDPALKLRSLRFRANYKYGDALNVASRSFFVYAKWV